MIPSNDLDCRNVTKQTQYQMSCVTTAGQQPLVAGVAVAVASQYTAEDLLTARHLHDTDDGILVHTRRTVGRARVLPQSAPRVLVPPDLWHSRGSMPSAGMEHTCCRGTGF